MDHLELESSGEQQFKCKFCEKGFYEKGNLNGHEHIHTGEKPFQCTFCEKVFSEKGHLTRHECTLDHFMKTAFFEARILLFVAESGGPGGGGPSANSERHNFHVHFAGRLCKKIAR